MEKIECLNKDELQQYIEKNNKPYTVQDVETMYNILLSLDDKPFPLYSNTVIYNYFFGDWNREKLQMLVWKLLDAGIRTSERSSSLLES